MSYTDKAIKGVKLEHCKLTKKQLAYKSSIMLGDNGQPLTIGELTLDQLRAHLYLTLREQAQCDKLVSKAYLLLQNALP